MSIDDEMSDKKRALLAYKSKLLNDVHYCEKRIEEMGKKQSQSYNDDDDSSDSDTGLTQPVKLGPTSHQLRAETSQLNLRLQATQELTSLQVLESEVNVLVDPPKLKDGKYPEEEGVWKEALAECKVDLIPYCITFYIFQPSKRFGSPSYYQLRVTPTKSGHEKELANSILGKVTKPSDAWQVLKSYSVASRSRRSTMARLCDKFGDAIVVGAAENGGFTIKCANLLEISWSLQNIWSPIMPFQHKMKFDLEYMDEHYIKAIKHAHKQLSDPSLETDERTSILTNILNTCIEAAGNISSVTESETDQSVHLTPVKRRTTLEAEPEIPVKKRTLNNGTESVMPPPKGVPKKVKTKDKENANFNRNGLERLSNGSSKTKGLIRDNFNKDDSAKTKEHDSNRDRLKSHEKGGSKDKVAGNIKDDGKLKSKEIARETDSNNPKRNKELPVSTKSKADKTVKDSEITSKVNNENKQKENLQAKEINAKDDLTEKKTAVIKTNEKIEMRNENPKKSSANHQLEKKNSEKRIENSQKAEENRENKRPKAKDDRPTSTDNRQKPTENNSQKNKNFAHDNRQNKDIKQKQLEIRQKLNENRQKTNENTRKQNENDKQNDKGRIDKHTNDKKKKYDKNDFNAKQNDKKNIIIKKNDKTTKPNDKFGIKSDKYRLISKSKIVPSGNSRKP